MKNKMEYAYAGGASADTGSTFGLSGAALKWIAMISMLIDHIGAVVVEYGLYYQGGAECFQKNTCCILSSIVQYIVAIGLYTIIQRYDLVYAKEILYEGVQRFK